MVDDSAAVVCCLVGVLSPGGGLVCCLAGLLSLGEVKGMGGNIGVRCSRL